MLVLLGGLDLRITTSRRCSASTSGAAPSSSTRAAPTPQVPDVTPEDIDRAIEIIRERVDSLGVSEPEISRVGEDQIEIGLPNVSNADRATESDRDHRPALPLRLRAQRHPAEPDVRTRRSGRTTASIDAVEAAAKQPEVSNEQCEKQGCTASGDTYYLFDENTLEPIGEPSEVKADLFANRRTASSRRTPR